MSIALDSAFPVSSTFDSESSVDDLFLDIGFSRKSVIATVGLAFAILLPLFSPDLSKVFCPVFSWLCLDSNRGILFYRHSPTIFSRSDLHQHKQTQRTVGFPPKSIRLLPVCFTATEPRNVPELI